MYVYTNTYVHTVYTDIHTYPVASSATEHPHEASRPREPWRSCPARQSGNGPKSCLAPKLTYQTHEFCRFLLLCYIHIYMYVCMY